MSKTGLPELSQIISSLTELNEYLKITNAKDADILSKFKAINFSSASVIEELFGELISVKDKKVLFTKKVSKVATKKSSKPGRDSDYLKKYQNKIDEAHKSYDFVVFTDGSADNISKEYVKYGCLIYAKGDLIETQCVENTSLHINERTSNTAECLAVLKACEFLYKEGLSDHTIMFFSDSEFTLNYLMDENWNKGNPTKGYYNSWIKLKELLSKFKNYNKSWIPRELNDDADKLTR